MASHLAFTLLVASSILTLSSTLTNEKSHKIIALLPGLREGSNTWEYSWERGREILAGAKLAVQMINANQTVLLNNSLEIIAIPTSGSCVCGEIGPVVSNLAERDDIVALVGLLCPEEVKIVSPVASRLHIHVQLSLSSSPKLFHHQRYPDLLNLVQSAETSIQVALHFAVKNRWYRVGILSDKFDERYFDTTRHFQTLSAPFNLKIRSIPFSKLSSASISHSLDSKFIVLALGISNVYTILCQANYRGHIWPEYAWVVLYHHVEDILSYTKTARVRGCHGDVRSILDGVIFIHQQLSVENDDRKQNHSPFSTSTEGNPYAFILYNIIWSMALTLEKNSSDVLGFLSNSDSNINLQRVKIYQIQNCSAKLLGMYANNSLEITHIMDKLAFSQVDSTDTVHMRSPTLFIILHMHTTLTFIFVTIILILYCYHRDQSSVKSTSWCLGLLIFTGCYLILLYVVVSDTYYLPQYKELSDSYRRFECLVRLWMHALGIPSVIVATLIVRIVRVYYIFRELSPANLRFSSDKALCVYISLIMVPTVTLLLLWTVDTALAYPDTQESDSGTNSTRGLTLCRSSHYTLWLNLLLTYYLVLLIALVLVAVITRNVNYSNFKDTKKVNALALMLVYTNVFTLSCWLMLQSIQRGENEESRLVLHVGHILVVMECQGLLFVPKIYPPVKNTFAKYFTKCAQ